MKCLFLLMIVLLTASIRAEDLKLKDGRVFKNYKVHKVDASGLVIFHETGGLTIEPKFLPDDMVEKYHLNQESVEVAKKVRALEAKLQNEIRKTKEDLKKDQAFLSGVVLQVIKGQGVLVHKLFAYKVKNEYYVIEKGKRTTQLNADYHDFAFVIMDTTDIVDGHRLQMVKAWKYGTKSYESLGNGSNTVAQYTTNFLDKL